MSSVSLRRDGPIAILTLDNPPVNAFSTALRQQLWDAIAAAEADAAVRAIVLTGAGALFSGGAEIREFGSPPNEPNLPALIDRVEGCTKPVVAAIHGTALGGGLEMALGCHFRVALAGTKLGLPEVKLGLLPGAGGTQRLPRLVGLVEAARMIVPGNPVDAAKAKAIGLVDEVAGADVVAAAVAFANAVLAEGRALRRLSHDDSRLAADKADPAAFEAEAAALLKRTRGLEAPQACVDTLRATLTRSYAEGTKAEREAFFRLRDGIQSKAQRHLFFSERAAQKVEGVAADTRARPIRKVAVLGSGTMGGGIAMSFATAGFPVTLVDPNPEALKRGMGIIEANYMATVKRGGMAEADARAAIARFTPVGEMEAVADADLIIEAVFENMALKREVFGKLDALAKPGAILATNTSTLDVDAIAAVTKRPADVIGMHFFSPANVMRLLEIVRGKATAPDVIKSAIDVGRRIGKVPVVVGVCYGFVGNRMLHARNKQVERMLLEGAAPAAIDAAATRFGFAMGPLAVGDLAGLDVGWRIRQERGEKAPVSDAICELGRYGQKTNAGYFRYEPPSRTPLPNPEIDALIARIATEQGVKQRAFEAKEIEERTVFPLINEAARILEEGIAARSSDIDLIWVHGYGWPVANGGPMFYADTVGVRHIRDRLAHYAAVTGDASLKPAPLIEKLAASGGSFGGA